MFTGIGLYVHLIAIFAVFNMFVVCLLYYCALRDE